MQPAPLMPSPTVDQRSADLVPAIGTIEIAGGCVGGLLALLAMTGTDSHLLIAAAATVVAAALLPHSIVIIARWNAVGNGGDQGLVRGGGLIQLAAGACALTLGISAIRGDSIVVIRVAAVVLSGALLIDGPAHSLVGPALPSASIFGPSYKPAAVTLVVALSAFFVAVYAAVVPPYSFALVELALLFTSLALVVAGIARRDRRAGVSRPGTAAFGSKNSQR